MNILARGGKCGLFRRFASHPNEPTVVSCSPTPVNPCWVKIRCDDMKSTSAVYVKVGDSIISGRGIRNLCQRLSQQDHGLDGASFEVFTFYDDVRVTTIRRHPVSGAWLRLIPEHWALLYEPKNNVNALNNKHEDDVQN